MGGLSRCHVSRGRRLKYKDAIKLLTGGPGEVTEWNRQRVAGEEIPVLIDADLSGANLSGANLVSANLVLGQLTNANLKNAKLSGASLIRVDLSGADLSAADLHRAIFLEANLRGATLRDAVCGSTTFAGVDLSEVKGLDTVRHVGPSTLGIDTLFLSKGNIPEPFLRGCGVPESVMENRFALIGALDAIQFYSCFISYSSKNRDFAERLHSDLQSRGIRCWFDQENLKIGEKFRHLIDQAIRVHDKLIVVLTVDSLASEWVEAEVEAALDRERREKRMMLFPLRLDDSVQDTVVAWAAHIRRTRQICDFSGWKDHDAYQTAIARLLKDLRASTEPT